MNKTQTALALALTAAHAAVQPDAPIVPDAVPFTYQPRTDLGRHTYVKALPVSREYLTAEQQEEVCAAAAVLGWLADPVAKGSLSAADKKDRATMKRQANKTIARLVAVQDAAREKACPSVVYMNGEAIDVNVSAVPYADLLSAIQRVTRQVHGANIRLAAKLNSLMPFAWFDIAAEEVSENSKILAGYKKPYYEMLKSEAVRHSNPSKAFADVRDYARNMRAGLAPNGKTLADGSALPPKKQEAGEGQSTGGANENEKRSPMLRNTEELIKLYKFNVGTNSVDQKLVDCQKGIVAALTALGVNVLTIKTDKSK